jgi:hypothetical protein
MPITAATSKASFAQCRLCGTTLPPRTFDPCEIVALIASAIALQNLVS